MQNQYLSIYLSLSIKCRMSSIFVEDHFESMQTGYSSVIVGYPTLYSKSTMLVKLNSIIIFSLNME